MRIHPLLLALAMPAAILPLSPAAAQQFSDGYTFLKAVKDRDGQKVTDMITEPGSRVIDSRDRTSGENALLIVVRRHDTTWVRFLLGKGANPDQGDKSGLTPLMLATQMNDLETMTALVEGGADVDKANDRGETPLILATQLRAVPAIRMLMKYGADADKADNVAGMSARDYAEQASRSPTVLEAIKDGEAQRKADATGSGAGEAQGPGL